MRRGRPLSLLSSGHGIWIRRGLLEVGTLLLYVQVQWLDLWLFCPVLCCFNTWNTLLLGGLHLDENLQLPLLATFLQMFLQLVGQAVPIDSLQVLQVGHQDLLDLIGLQMANEVPLDIQGQLGSLLLDLVHIILAEMPDPGFIGFLYLLD